MLENFARGETSKASFPDLGVETIALCIGVSRLPNAIYTCEFRNIYNAIRLLRMLEDVVLLCSDESWDLEQTAEEARTLVAECHSATEEIWKQLKIDPKYELPKKFICISPYELRKECGFEQWYAEGGLK